MRRTLLVIAAVLALAVALLPTTRANSLLLDATTKSLEMETSAAVSTDYVASWADHTSSAFTPGMSQGNVASATTTAIIAAPAASTQRQVKWINVYNRSTTTAQTITIKLDVSATEYYIARQTLAPTEWMRVDATGESQVYTSGGLRRTQATDVSGYSGRPYAYHKAGTAKDAAGYWIAYGKDTGFPGAYSLGTPGLNGVATNCNVAGSAGSGGALSVGAHVLPDAASGSYYLTSANLSASVVEFLQLHDVLWYNTGLAVTTTTAQNITFPGLPARDINGSTNGTGVYAALLTTTANTNASVITNTTISYTDQDGNAGATGTYFAAVGWQAPATPVIGTWMQFALAAGDTGIRSVQSVTLGTSYGAGALSLVLYRPLASIPNLVAGIGGIAASPQFFPAPGIRVYNGTCVMAASVSAATTAANLSGTYTIMER